MSYIKPYWLEKHPKWILVDCDPVLGSVELAEIEYFYGQWKITIRFDSKRVNQKDREFNNRVKYIKLFDPFNELKEAKEAVEKYFGPVVMELGVS